MIFQNAGTAVFRRTPGRRLAGAAAGLAFCLMGQAAQAEPAPADGAHRSAILSAFRPEWLALQESLESREEHVVNGTVFLTGTIERKPVVLFLSGVSMVNAAMTVQLALDHFTIDRIVFSGIAGGVDPDLKIGDVVVPEAWSQYLEAVFARETAGGYQLPPFADRSENFGMIFPQSVEIARGKEKPERKVWFPVDAQLLETARATAAATVLAQCTADNRCLDHRPKVVVGGNGVSGQAFVDNKAFREYTARVFDAQVLDMESAAVAHVAYANGTPFIAFRSLSDLAGGGDGENEMTTFLQLASENSAAVVRAFLKGIQ
jgi:adenosylhomocysteine nucleosidase